MIKEDWTIPKKLEKQFDKEYERFCKWARVKMTKSEFLEFSILQTHDQILHHRATLLFFSITPTKIEILDRKNKEKVIVKRVHDYLLCKKDNDIACLHCNFCQNDKEVKKSLNPKYAFYVRQYFKPKIEWSEFKGQKLDFDTIIGNKTFFDDIPKSDYPIEF